MAQGLEADAAEEWLKATLSGDATLTSLVPNGVWPGGTAPQGVPFPFVTFQFESGTDLMEVGANRIWTNLLYLVKVVGETADYQTLRTAVARIDVLLHRGSGTPTDGIVWACTRQRAIRYSEVDSGKQYRHSGGQYRLLAT